MPWIREGFIHTYHVKAHFPTLGAAALARAISQGGEMRGMVVAE